VKPTHLFVENGGPGKRVSEVNQGKRARPAVYPTKRKKSWGGKNGPIAQRWLKNKGEKKSIKRKFGGKTTP